MAQAELLKAVDNSMSANPSFRSLRRNHTAGTDAKVARPKVTRV